jgi:hypothetical protein
MIFEALRTNKIQKMFSGLEAIQIIRDILGGTGFNSMSHRLYFHFETLFLVPFEVKSFVSQQD